MREEGKKEFKNSNKVLPSYFTADLQASLSPSFSAIRFFNSLIYR